MIAAREVWRKIAHVFLGMLVLGSAWWVAQTFGQDVLETSTLVLLLVLVLCDVLIADYKQKLPVYSWLERPHEERTFHTVTLAVLAGFFAFKLFVLPVALAGVSMFIFGDAAAALVGKKWGRRELGKKSWAGTAAMFVVSALVGWAILGWIGIVMALVATLAECLVTKIDDAVTIPLFAGAVGQLLIHFL